MSSKTISTYISEGYKVVNPEVVYGRSSRLALGDVEYEGGYREALPEDVYGNLSTLEVSNPVDAVVPHLTSEPLYHTLLVVTLVAYLFMLLRSWKFIDVIYSGIFDSQSERRMVTQGGLLPLQHFKRGAALIGAMVLALVFVRLGQELIPATSSIYIKGIAELSVVGGIVAVVVFSAWVYALHEVAEWLTASDGARILASIGYINFVRAVVLLYPVVAMWLLADDNSSSWISTVLIVSMLPVVAIYLKDTFSFFISKKISILYWILYLCTAIFLPLSFVMHMLPEFFG